ncbi:hypothetical protein ACQP2Y_21100 [Actinoplanes sp. CA-051413]|uniref:hypothetical protein n=1 Tax=Actinoplanes sp. CA-051413 TaxID=3239899 RepID=UPI003D99B245
MKLMTQPGDTLTEGFGPDLATPALLVTMTREHNGIAFQVSNGAGPINELCKPFTNREHAIGYYRLLRDAAMAGKRIHQIVAEAAALVEMMDIDTARTEQEIAEAINAEVDAHHAQVVATHNQVVETVAEVMAGTAQTGGWYGARKAAQQTAAPASDAMVRILAQAERDDGRIIRSREATSSQLVALHRRGLVELTYQWRGNQRVIAGATLVRNLSEVAA